MNLEPVTLTGELVRLEPLSTDHVPALLEAASVQRDTYGLTLVPNTLEGMTAYVQTALDGFLKHSMLPFATVDARSNRIVGSTRLMNIEFWPWASGAVLERKDGTPDVAEIGSTWLAQDAQRSGINTEAKRLMLEFAFTVWKVRCVRLKTDARNERSRNAILRLGANFDGILRAHMPASDGAVRDSAYYSILASEWDDVNSRLEGFLSKRS
jgi:N-acetyltransferase